MKYFSKLGHKGPYNPNFFDHSEEIEMLRLKDKFIIFLGVYSDEVSSILDEILHELCRCMITEFEEKEVVIFLPADPQMINVNIKFEVTMSDELMNDKEAANTIMFLFFNLDDYDRDYFLDGLKMGGSFDYIPRKCDDFILNCIKHYFEPIHSILAE